jgi:cathepsin L
MMMSIRTSFVFLFLSLFAAVVSTSVNDDDQHLLFQKFVKDFDKDYATEHERDYRYEIFKQNLYKIKRHNDDDKSPFKLGITPFADLLPHELPLGHDKNGRNVKHLSLSRSSPSSYLRIREAKPKLPSSTILFDQDRNVSKLPKEIDWRKNNLGQPVITSPIKNQRSCGSCWAFAATATLESHIAIQTGTLLELSVQELVSCVPNPLHCGGNGGCTGSTVEIALEFVSQHGIVDEWSFGYQSGNGAKVNCTITDQEDGNDNKTNNGTRTIKGAVASIVGFASLPSNSYSNLMHAVATMGPVAVTVAASSWGLYKEGVFDDSKSDHRDLNHAVVLEGYGTDEITGEDFWLIRNSWGPTWGEGGRIRLKRVDPTTLDDPSSDCKTDVTPANGIACTKDVDGNDIIPPTVTACGTSGVLFDSVVPIGGHLLS